jgi:rhamnogalacturonan endolyase
VKKKYLLAAGVLLLLGSSVLVRANLPGGGTNGAAVTLTDNGTTVTLANGIVSIVITKADASIHTINYTFKNSSSTQTINLLGSGYSGGKFYWENSSDLGPAFTYAVVANPTNNGGNYAEVALTANGTNNVANITMEAHFSMLRGNSGFYVTPIWIHGGGDAAFSMGECRDNIYSGSIFNWMSVDATRNKLMPVSGGSAIAVDSGPAEVSLWTGGICAGLYEDKYKYTADYSTLRAWGWSSVGSAGKNVGLWDVAGSSEYMASGPMRRELICHMGTTILNTPHGGHYGFCSDSTWAAGEVWAKVCGPHFIYCNNITNAITLTNTAAQALYADALAQSDAEVAAWPYAWFTNANYALASGRGTVTGKMVIADAYNPNASASNLWVGVELQPATISTLTYDFQKWYKPYQFWTHTDANGNFTIPDVIATNGYTLYAFGPGAAGTFQSQNQLGANSPNELDIPASPFSVTVPAGGTNNLGTVTWTPYRFGPTVFEIGYPDRTAGKFRHGEDWWVGDIGPSATAPSPVWSKFLEYPFDFPNGLTYTVGQSRWTTDWNFIQPVVINNNGAYNPWANNAGTTSTILFNLPSAPATNGSLYIATASSYQGPLIVTLNNNDVTLANLYTNGFDPSYDNSGSGSDASIREGIHGLFADKRLVVSKAYLRAGQNTLTITMRKGGYLANHSMYDYLRLELPGYIPPVPSNVVAYAGNHCNLVCWPVQPGATSYNVLRSTTNGSGYVSITNGVMGPVCGSGWNNAVFFDTNAANSTNYYYVVRAVNTVGSSTNSPPAAATPDAGISASAPASPTSLTVGSVGHQSVTLNWSAVSNVNFYTVYRSTLYNNGGGASNVLNTIVLANNVTNAAYTDTSPTDGSIYRYAVAATSAGGTSTNSVPAVAVPKPAAPAAAPSSLFITSVINTNPAQDVTLTWNAVSGAVGYAIYRATSAGGPFTFLQSVSTTIYFNGGLATNQIYYYRVVALNAAGVSSYATDAINPLQIAPTNLVAAASVSTPQITLTWNTTPGATSYTVKRGTSVAGESTTVVSGYSGTTYTNTGLQNGVTYYYVVTATGANGASGNSPEASATPGSSIWISPVSGTWGASSNWSGGGIASGPAAIADFSTLSLPGDVTVTLDSARTVGTMKFGDTSFAYNWTLAGTNTLTLAGSASVNVVNNSATIGAPIAGTAGLKKSGAGALTLVGSNTFTGGLTNNSGTVTLDFSAATAPASNLVPAADSLVVGGGTLQIAGSSNSVSSQSFNGTVIAVGGSIISAAPVSGSNDPTVALGSTTENLGGTIEFVGPATTNSSGSLPATANITTTTAGEGIFGAIGGFGYGKNGAYATVGLYDFASTDTTAGGAGASPFTIIGGSQVAGFYQSTGITTTSAAYDVPSSGGVNTLGNAAGSPMVRFNQPAALTITLSATTAQNIQGILVTPKVGTHNTTFTGGGLEFYRNQNAGASYGVIWQNNTAGYLNFNSVIEPGRLLIGGAGTTCGLIQAGCGTVFYNGVNDYDLNTYLNGGYSVVTADSGFGRPSLATSSVGVVYLNGGTIVGNATFAMDNSGSNLRYISVGNAGGSLAATAGNTMTVDGLVGSAAGAGPLVIGIAASSANNFTAGLLPGSGPGTANTTPVYATGTVVLTNANYYFGGTVLQSGTLNINGIYALGGANYGGLAFNGGTLQYATSISGSNGSPDLTSIGTAGITLAAGGGTIDLNSNAVTYAGSIGNNGSGALTVASSQPGGALTFQSGNAYAGNTTVTNATLIANNASGSATGSGDVLIQNAATLSGNGAIAGSVTVAAGGTLSVSNTDSLTIGENLTLNSGSVTRLQIQHSPPANSSVNAGNALTFGGALVVTNLGGALTNGDSFQLFSAANFAGTFSSLNLPALATNLFWNTNLLLASGTLSVASYQRPVIAQLMIDGGNLIIAGTGGIPVWNYYVLASTNLASPNWTAIATNQFDASGNFNFTNLSRADFPQVYYRIQVQ